MGEIEEWGGGRERGVRVHRTKGNYMERQVVRVRKGLLKCSGLMYIDTYRCYGRPVPDASHKNVC